MPYLFVLLPEHILHRDLLLLQRVEEPRLLLLGDGSILDLLFQHVHLFDSTNLERHVLYLLFDPFIYQAECQII